MNDNEIVSSNDNAPGTPIWPIVVLASVLSGAVSATVGYMLGAKKMGSCSCKTRPGNAKTNGGEKAG